jgi:hypothetical protein
MEQVEQFSRWMNELIMNEWIMNEWMPLLQDEYSFF